jgi:hypothetical protein
MWIVILEGSCYGPFDAYQVAEEWAERSECCGMKFEIKEVLIPEDKVLPPQAGFGSQFA